MIINFLNSEGCYLVRCDHVIEDLWIAAKDFKFIYFSHVRRTENSVAQHLAKKQKKKGLFGFFLVTHSVYSKLSIRN